MMHPVFYEIIAWSKSRRGEFVEPAAAACFHPALYWSALTVTTKITVMEEVCAPGKFVDAACSPGPVAIAAALRDAVRECAVRPRCTLGRLVL
jgi:hypothetical protein